MGTNATEPGLFFQAAYVPFLMLRDQVARSSLLYHFINYPFIMTLTCLHSVVISCAGEIIVSVFFSFIERSPHTQLFFPPQLARGPRLGKGYILVWIFYNGKIIAIDEYLEGANENHYSISALVNLARLNTLLD